MKRHLVVAAAALGFAFIASGAQAQFVDPVCGFEHPQKAKETKSSLVQGFMSCGNPGGNAPNDTTESGTQTCSPPETYASNAGADQNTWHWDFAKGQGTVSFKAAKNKLEDPLDPNNPPGDTADVAVSLKLQGLIDQAGDVNGSGSVATLSRATLRDRNNTPGNNGDDVPMTVIDFPVAFPFDVIDGKAKLKTTANALLNPASLKSLPHCTSIEVIDINVFDENDDVFARMGTFLPSK